MISKKDQEKKKGNVSGYYRQLDKHNSVCTNISRNIIERNLDQATTLINNLLMHMLRFSFKSPEVCLNTIYITRIKGTELEDFDKANAEARNSLYCLHFWKLACI